MSLEQIIVLAIVQGLAEFLPISSSGHLILIPAFTGWPDQGIITDIMVHVGSLFAVVVYFWRDVIRLVQGGFDLLRLRMNANSWLALYIILATIPAVAFGLYLKTSGLQEQLRMVEIIAWNLIVFGVVLYIADRFGSRLKDMDAMTLNPALVIGIAQALALIPGTSRSGITISAARILGFERAEAARFSFLLGIPAIAGAGILELGNLASSGETISSDALWAAFLTFFAALAAITILMAVVRRASFLIFVIYRLALGLLLLAMIYGWFPDTLPALG